MASQHNFRELLQKEKLIIGANETRRALSKGELATILLAANCSDEIKKDLEHYASLSKTPVEVLESSNDELGTIVKKPFAVSVLGVKK